MGTRNFHELLEARWAANHLVCVGLDSDYPKIPGIVREQKSQDVGQSILEFNRAIVDATHDLVEAYKPNIAFYAAYGRQGLAALRDTIGYINFAAREIPVILDVKRGDIGSTNVGYVLEAFDYLNADAITVHPYLGAEALQPFLERKEKGIFILCRTSNPGAGEFQDMTLTLPSGRYGGKHYHVGPHLPLYQFVAHRVATEWNKNGNCGLVVGATYPEELRQVRALVGDMPILMPGIGTQGGDVEKAVKAGMDSRGAGMVINSSRGIIFASDGADFADAARLATLELDTLVNQHRKETVT